MSTATSPIHWLQLHRVWIARLTLLPVLIYLFAIERIAIHPLASSQAGWGIGTILVGVIIRSLSAGALHKNSTLSISGIYALVRNPLYVGSFLFLLGICMVINHPLFWLTSLAVFALTYIPTILAEERGLQQAFPAQWQQFVTTTPRFIPNILRIGALAQTQWSARQWLKNHEHNSVIAAIVILTLLETYNRLWALH